MNVRIIGGALATLFCLTSASDGDVQPLRPVAEVFTRAQTQRLAQIVGRGLNTGDPRDGMWAAMAGVHNGLTLADVKLLKEDRRRAQAAYPEVSAQDLFEGRWIGCKPNSVPQDYGGGNSEGTQGPDGKFYLDSAYFSVVRAQYTKRTTRSEADAYFARKKAADSEKRLADLRDNGTSSSWGGTGGSGNFVCKPGGDCVVQFAAEWSPKATRYTFPFVPEEWVDRWPWSASDLKAFPSFVHARIEMVPITPNGVTVSMGSASPSRHNGITLMPGQSMGVSVSIEP